MLMSVAAGLTAPLSELKAGETATIRALHAQDGFAHRLEALGFRVGRSIKVIRLAPLGGPMQVRIGTTDVMLRRADANRIAVSLVFP